VPCKRDSLRATAGSRPPLLCMCVRVSQKSPCLRRTNTVQPGAGGVSPPWFGNRACKGDSAHVHPRPSHRNAIAGGVSPPWITKTRLQRRFPQYTDDCRRRTEEPQCNRSSQNHGGLVAVCDSPRTCVVEPRRAHARRSWARAFVHRKNRFSPADIRTANQERGALAPRGRHSTSELAARKFVALHLQTRFTNPRRAHARRSRLRVRGRCASVGANRCFADLTATTAG